MSTTSLHIAILDCDTPVPKVLSKLGKYSDIFSKLLRDALSTTKELPRGLQLRFSAFDSVMGECPSEEELRDIDGVIITGSSASAYDSASWVTELTTYVKDLYISHPEIKIFGSCFGHQLLCSALFSTPTHQVVTKDPSGWELGIHAINLSTPFLALYGPVWSNPSSPSSLRLQFVHADHVTHPTSHEAWVSEGWQSIGASQHCKLQGVWRKGRVLTYQGHAEFDAFVNGETIKVFGAAWKQEMMEAAMRGVQENGDDDSAWAAGVMLRFFLERADNDVTVGEKGVEVVEVQEVGSGSE